MVGRLYISREEKEERDIPFANNVLATIEEAAERELTTAPTRRKETGATISGRSDGSAGLKREGSAWWWRQRENSFERKWKCVFFRVCSCMDQILPSPTTSTTAL